MAKPIILTLDDEPQVLNAVERDLRQQYRSDYRIIKSSSGIEALEVLQKLKQRNDSVALFLVDQRMPELSGTDFLDQARKLYPDAKKVLLTAYADTEAAISSINEIGLDYYLMKPWDPPEQNLYPILDDLLSDWEATVPLPYDGIRVAGTLWSAKSHDVKDFLGRNRIPYQWLDIEIDAQARKLVEYVSEDQYRLPVVFFPDGKQGLQWLGREHANPGNSGHESDLSGCPGLHSGLAHQIGLTVLASRDHQIRCADPPRPATRPQRGLLRGGYRVGPLSDRRWPRRTLLRRGGQRNRALSRALGCRRGRDPAGGGHGQPPRHPG